MNTQTIEKADAPTIDIGSRVRLKGCSDGRPGTAIKVERRRLVVFWHDLDFLSRHHPDSLVLDEDTQSSVRNLDSPL